VVVAWLANNQTKKYKKIQEKYNRTTTHKASTSSRSWYALEYPSIPAFADPASEKTAHETTAQSMLNTICIFWSSLFCSVHVFEQVHREDFTTEYDHRTEISI
jgi:hypothetical protein